MLNLVFLLSIPFQAEIEQQLAQRKVFLLGTDKYGRAVLLLRAGKHLPSEDLAMVKKFIVYCYDAARRACDPVVNPGRHVVGVLDLSQLEYKNLDFKGLKAMFMVRSDVSVVVRHTVCATAGCQRCRLWGTWLVRRRMQCAARVQPS